MRINHNISAMNAYRNLAINNQNTSNSLEKLSSGLRINKAADDAAGLAISEKMRSQIRGLDMAERNALDGVSLIQTAEGALSSTHEILQRMRELSVQAANDTNTDTDRQEIQKEINQLTSEINRIGSATEFNTSPLLDGSRSNSFKANGQKAFGNGTSLMIDPKTDIGLAISDDSLLTEGTHTITVTKKLGKDNPLNETPNTSAVFAPYGDALAGEIGINSAAAADDWTLTYVKGKSASFADGTASVKDLATGLQVDIAGDGKTLAAGAHNVKVSALYTGDKFDGGVSSYQINPVKSDVTVTGSGTSVFSNDEITFNNTAGNPAYSSPDTLTLTYKGQNQFLITNTNKSISDTYTVGTDYSEHGLSFNMLSADGYNSGDSLSFTINSQNETVSTKLVGYDPAYTGTEVVFAKPITVSSEVGEGDWTITKETAGWTVSFKGNDKSGNPAEFTDTLASDTDAFNSHGVSFQVGSAAGMQAGKTIKFSTKPADKYYDFTIDIDGVKNTVADQKGTGSAGNISTTGVLAAINGFSDLGISAENLSEGQFSFVVDPAEQDTFTLVNADGSKTASIEVGKPFNQYGLEFEIADSGNMLDREKISFSTPAAAYSYEYQVSLDGGTPVTVSTGSPAGTDPAVSNITDFPGLNLDSMALKEGTFHFEVQKAGTGQDNSVSIQIGANAGQSVSLEIGDMRAGALQVANASSGGVNEITLSDNTKQKVWYTEMPTATDGKNSDPTQYAIDITSSEKAQAAITVFDDAIQRVSSERARMGAMQNRLEYTVDNLKTMNENVTSAESRIRDVDMALEMTNFTKNNILNQAAQAMLAQANQMPQGVLQLLK